MSARLGRGPLGPEFRLIDRLADRLPDLAAFPKVVREGLRVGIGDDAAVWRLPDGSLGLLTVDTVVEGVHFYPHESPADIGARAFTAAVSDVAAMGGDPLFAVIALQSPPAGTVERLEEIYSGIGREAAALGVAVVGGDVVDTPGPLAFAVTVYGTCPAEGPWQRDGVQPGDVLAVTGSLGGSRAGLVLIADPEHPPEQPWARRLAERHLRPRARVAAARAIRGLGPVHAAQDISDGLSSECWHLALASGVRLHLEAGAIPCHPDLDTFLATAAAGETGPDPVAFALDSGEEYELLLALPAGHPALEAEDLGGEGPLTIIGRAEDGEAGVVLERPEGSTPVRPGGWSHGGADGGRA